MPKKLPLLFSFLSLLYLSTGAEAASMVTADHKGGYSGLIMDSVLPHWTAPKQNTRKPTRILLEISGDGKLEQCRILSSSGSSTADKAACASAKKAAPFTAPPHNLPMDVYMSFWTGQATGSGKTAVKSPQSAASKPMQAHVVEENPTTTAAETTAQTELRTSLADPQKSASPPASEKNSIANTQNRDMMLDGIDYSSPRKLPKGLGSMDDLVGVKLPPSDTDTAMETPSAVVPEKPKSPFTQNAQGDFVIDFEKDDDPKPEELKEEQEYTENVEAQSPAYAAGKEPFIQDNRKGQVMDENDYYVNKVLRKIRDLVVFPNGLQPGIVSTSITLHIKGNGNVIKAELSSSSRNKALDQALVEASNKVTGLAPHPSGKAQELYLIFMVETPQP